MSSIRRCLFCKCLLSADRDGLCIVSYQQKAGSMYLGDLTEESDSLLGEERKDKGCLPSEGSSGCHRLSLLVSSLSVLYVCPGTPHKH